MIKYYKPIAVALALSICVFMSAPVFSAEEITEGMNQGDFAMLLIKELGAEGLLPAAATVNDAFALLEKLGVVPTDGWDVEGTVSKDDLVTMLGDKTATGSFDVLLEKLETRMIDVLSTMGVNVGNVKTISPSGGGK